jgi:eukaryotic-like serine/threonine-protein kinase
MVTKLFCVSESVSISERSNGLQGGFLERKAHDWRNPFLLERVCSDTLVIHSHLKWNHINGSSWESRTALAQSTFSSSSLIGPKLAAFGKYRLVAEIGQGGMAEVYLAVMEGPGSFTKLIALKILRPAFAEDPDGLAMFLDEARLAARLDHPNVVQTYEVGAAENRHYIAMEYLDGQPFSRTLRSSRNGEQCQLPIEMSLRVIAETLAGLHHAHELSDFDGTHLCLVHRDVSPHNVFITYDGRIKVLDFGIAKAVGGSSETRTGVLKGKVGYMAPEQMMDVKLDRRADIFAAGVMLWEAVARRRVWKGMADVAILTTVVNSGIPGIRTAVPDIPEQLERIVSRATAYRREERYDTAEEFQFDLEGYLDSIGERVLPREIGKVISEAFSDVRNETKKIIETQVTLSRSMAALTSSVELVALPQASISTDRADSSSIPSSSLASHVRQREEPSLQEEPKKSPRDRVLIGAIGVLAMVMAVGIYVISMRKSDAKDNVTAPAATQALSAAPTAPPTTKQSAAPTPAVSAATKDVVKDIELLISASPSQSELYMDGKKLESNPIVMKIPQDDKEHELEVRAKGYENHTEKLFFKSNQKLVLSLKKEIYRGGGVAVVRPNPNAKKDNVTPPTKSTATSKKRQLDQNNPFDLPNTLLIVVT